VPLLRLDPKTFSTLNAMVEHPSLLQEPVGAMKQALDKIAPAMEKLKNVDSKTYDMISKLLAKAGNPGAMSFLEAPDMEERLIKLQPVLEKLRGLDPKTFGLLNNMMDQAQAHESFLQESPVEVEDKLARLGPILEKLKGLDPKAFGALSNVVSQAASTASKGEGQSQTGESVRLLWVGERNACPG